jgi:hypothetical protein
MSSSIAAIWSAVAASFAALSSVLVMLIQRRSLLESARPELVLSGWSRKTVAQGDAPYEILRFERIRNVGKGSALQVVLNSSQISNNRPTAIMSTTRLPIIAPNEEQAIDGQITLWWKNVEPNRQGHKHLFVSIDLMCWDSRGYRHRTTYTLLAVELSSSVTLADQIALGVALSNRVTVNQAIRLLRLSRAVRRVPLVGRLVATD